MNFVKARFQSFHLGWRWQREVVEKFLEEKFSTASEGSLHWFVLMAFEGKQKRMQASFSIFSTILYLFQSKVSNFI